MNLTCFLMFKIQSMSEFRVFEVDKRSKFLGKAKESKAKREEEIKRTKAVILLQKNIRAYLTSIRYSSQQYPLFIRTPKQLQQHHHFVSQLLGNRHKYPLILKAKILSSAIKFMSRGLQLEVDVNCLLEVLGEMVKAGRVNLQQRHYEYLIEFFFQVLSGSPYFSQLYQEKPFKSALGRYISFDLHKLIRVIYKLNNTNLVNSTVRLFEDKVKGCPQSLHKEAFHQKQSLEEISTSYEQVLQILLRAVEHGQQDRGIIYVLSLIIERLKRKYIENILIKYKIDEQVFLSPSLREESEELLKEKKEWKRYEECLVPLSGLLGHFLSKFYKYGAAEIRAVLNIVIQLSKLNVSFGALKLQNNQFFSLIERLDFKMSLNRQSQELKFNEIFFVLAILKSFLESINDLQFKNSFRFDCERLQKAIRSSLIRFMKDMCTVNSQSDTLQEAIEEAVSFMSNLYNKIFRTHLLATTVFEDSSLVVFQADYNFSNTNYFNELRKIVERAPFLMPIETRFMMFKDIIKEHRQPNYFYGQHNVRVRRGHEFQDAFEALYQRGMKNRFKVVFVNRYGFEETGFDAGGLTKELLTRVFKVAFDPKFGLFMENSQRELMPHPNFKDIQTGQRKAKEFEFVGQLLGKSLYQNIMLGVKFAGPFLNLLINRRNSFDDLEAIDPELYRSLAFIATMDTGVEELQLRFQYPEEGRVIDLVPRGDKIRVTDDNKMQYINLLINYKVNQAFERQTWFIRRGLKSVIDQKWVQMFNYAELNYLISGTGSIDLQDWQKHTRYAGNIDNTYINDFWQVIKEFSEEERSLLLKFVTSCQRPSFLGFRDLIPPFTVNLLAEGTVLPVSHTCSNVLDLPRYSSRKMLQEKLLYAIKSDSGFQFA